MIGYVGLFKIELPGHTALLTDGGFITFDGERYTSYDSVLGSIAGVEMMTEGKTGEIPAVDLTFNIPNATAITTFSQGALQRSRIRIWLAKYTVADNQVSGTPDLQFNGQIDQPNINIGRATFTVSLATVSKTEWFFARDTGNGLSSTFHKDLYAGETGHDNATGLSIPVAWGVAGPSSGGGGGNGRIGTITDARGPFSRVDRSSF